MNGKIAYIMSRFPHLSETFILREMNELTRHGWDIALYPLILQKQPVVHAEAKPWLSEARYVPFFSKAVLMANLRAFFAKRPHRYLGLWGQTVSENLHRAKFLLRSIALLPKAFQMAQLMQQEGISHIHAHYATHPALVAWLIHQMTGISYSITVHAHDIFVCTPMLATKLRDASFIAAISEFNRDYLAHLLGPWVRDKTHIVHCGVHPSAYQARTRPLGENQRLELITVGSLQPYKGHPYLIQACVLLQKQGIPFRCRIIGGGEQEPLKSLIRQARLEDVVQLMGPQPQHEVARLLPTAHCYVQPSIITPAGKMEGIPVAIMEALASGLPVVATSLSGIPELVRPGQTGYLVPPKDPVALANSLAKVYHNPKRAYELAQAGRALVQEEFELSSNVQRLATLFEQL